MNIYISVEIAIRELDSKLLLAVIAAARGHQVVVSEQNIIKRALNSGLINSGIFHSKSLTPNYKKIALHQALINKGFLITSIDEEGCLIDHGYEMFAKNRYSKETLDQSSATFCWGRDDSETLKKFYPNHSLKIYKTGSPRVDLWNTSFSEYWGKPKNLPLKPFILISSSMETFMVKSFSEIINFHKSAGYYERDPKLLQNQIGTASESYTLTSTFIEAIKYLSDKNKNYDIVLRPHPVENIDAWKASLDGIPNVHVIREGSISAWIHHAFAVMHNSCATSLETLISDKPLITYIPFDQKFERKLANELGYRIFSKEELLKTVNNLFETRHKKLKNDLPENVLKKIHLDPKELAANKIINLWEKIGEDVFLKSNGMMKFEFFLKFINLKHKLGNLLNIFPSEKFIKKNDWKFPPLNNNEVVEKVNRLKNILKINEKIECKILTNQTILIRKV